MISPGMFLYVFFLHIIFVFVALDLVKSKYKIGYYEKVLDSKKVKDEVRELSFLDIFMRG